jgi:hypothetical protein
MKRALPKLGTPFFMLAWRAKFYFVDAASNPRRPIASAVFSEMIIIP